ncbi:MAG: CapA family protein [Nocardioidaceae bacterium]|nr:CapA family protein [Nocardioidaceae bacterium]
MVGDIMLGRRVGELAAAAGDPSAPLRPMAARLGRADITVGNLESTLSDNGAPRQGDDSFAAPPTVLPGLADAGFDVLTLANNHAGDYGRPALVETVRAFADSGIEPLGAGANRREAWRPVVVEHDGVRVGFLAFNAIGETWRAGSGSAGVASLRMNPRTGPLYPVELDAVADRVRALAARSDVTIVLPHWGDQYTHEPVADQRLVGARLLDAGATAVVGGHPHWVQDVQRHKGRFVVQSLGNFVFDMDFMQETQEGFVLDMTFRDGELVGTHLTPYVIGPDFAPRPATGAQARAILDDIDGLDLLP